MAQEQEDRSFEVVASDELPEDTGVSLDPIPAAPVVPLAEPIGWVEHDSLLAMEVNFGVQEAYSRAGDEAEPLSIPAIHRFEPELDLGLLERAPDPSAEAPAVISIPVLPGAPDAVKYLAAFRMHDDGVRTWVGGDSPGSIPDTFLVVIGDTWFGEFQAQGSSWLIRPAPGGGHVVVEVAPDPAEPATGPTCLTFDHGSADPSPAAEVLGFDPSMLEASSEPQPLEAPEPSPIDILIAYTAEAEAEILAQWAGYCDPGSIFGQPDVTPWGLTPGNAPAAVVGYAYTRILTTNHILLNSGITSHEVRLAGVVKVRSSTTPPGTNWCPLSAKVDFTNGCTPSNSFSEFFCNDEATNGCTCCGTPAPYDISVDGVYERDPREQDTTEVYGDEGTGTDFDQVGDGNYTNDAPLCAVDPRPVCAVDGFVPGTGDPDAWPDSVNGGVLEGLTGTAGRIIPLFAPFEGAWAVHEVRSLVGADVVALLRANSYRNVAGVASGSKYVNFRPKLLPDQAAFWSLVSKGATDNWTFAHEFGHVLGAVHSKQEDHWNGNMGFKVKDTLDPWRSRSDLMHGDNDANGPRLPVFSSATVKYTATAFPVPGGNATYRVDGTFGISGSEELREPAGAQDLTGYLTSVWDGVQTPLQRVAGHAAPVANSALRLVSPEHHVDLPTAGQAANAQTFTWVASPYALNLLNLTSDDPQAYQVLIGSSFGASDLVSTFLPASQSNATDVALRVVRWTWSATLPNAPVFVRVRWKLDASTWISRDYAFNVRDRLVSCSLEDPSFVGLAGACAVHPSVGVTAAPCAVDDLDPSTPGWRKRVTCDMSWGGLTSLPGAGAGTQLAVGRKSGRKDWDYRFSGTSLLGEAWCCLYDAHQASVGAVELQGVGSVGGNGIGEEYRFTDPSGAFSSLRPYWVAAQPSSSGTPIRFIAQMRTLSGADDLHGSTYSGNDYREYLRGQRGADDIWGYEGADWLIAGRETDPTVEGGPGNDVLVDIDGNDVLKGQGGEDTLCDADGGTTTLDGGGNDAKSVLFVSSGAATAGLTSLGVKTGSTCGFWVAPPPQVPPVPLTPPSWMPAGCTSFISVAPGVCNDPLICPSEDCVPN
jgi:hypothetical protein